MNWVAPFLTGVLKGFTAVMSQPGSRPSVQQQEPVIDLTDAGGADGMYWFAIPYAQARAFKAANPQAYAADLYFNIIEGWRHTAPAAYYNMQPFTQQLIEAVERYGGSCQLFVVQKG
jgi:hypothetical protein